MQELLIFGATNQEHATAALEEIRKRHPTILEGVTGSPVEVILKAKHNYAEELKVGRNALFEAIKECDSRFSKCLTLEEVLRDEEGLQCITWITLKNETGKPMRLPPEIARLSNLSTLNAYECELTELPPEIGKCTKLECLTFPDNLLRELPREIGKCSKIRKLDVTNNSLTLLPAEIGGCVALTYLGCDNNSLVELPRELGTRKVLVGLRVSDNCLQEAACNSWSM